MIANVPVNANINEFRARIAPFCSFDKTLIEVSFMFKIGQGQLTTVNTTADLRLAINESLASRVAEFKITRNGLDLLLESFVIMRRTACIFPDSRVPVVFIQHPTKVEVRDTIDSRAMDPKDLLRQASDALNLSVRACILWKVVGRLTCARLSLAVGQPHDVSVWRSRAGADQHTAHPTAD